MPLTGSPPCSQAVSVLMGLLSTRVGVCGRKGVQVCVSGTLRLVHVEQGYHVGSTTQLLENAIVSSMEVAMATPTTLSPLVIVSKPVLEVRSQPEDCGWMPLNYCVSHGHFLK